MTNILDKYYGSEILSNETEQRILKSAEHEFLTKGFDGARINTIAEAAGVTHAMLHYYFRTKARLFERIIESKVELIRTILTNSIEDTDKSLQEIITYIIERHFDFLKENPDLPLFIVNELYSNSTKKTFFIDKLSSAITSAVERLQKKINEEAFKGKCRFIDAQMLMLDIVSLNIFPFLAAPAIETVFKDKVSYRQVFLEQRKKHNLKIILNLIKI